MGLLSRDARQQWPYVLIELSGEGGDMIQARKVGDFQGKDEAMKRAEYLNRICPKLTYLAIHRQELAQMRASGGKTL